MNKPNAELHKKIEEIISISNSYIAERSEKHPSAAGELIVTCLADVSATATSESKPLLVDALNKLSSDELAYIMAVMWYGRSHLDGGDSGNFSAFLYDAKKSVNKTSVNYIAEKWFLNQEMVL